jgi:hypothetical protein
MKQMTGIEVVQTLQKQNVHNLITPLAVAIALKIALACWTNDDTVRYGTRVRSEIERLATSMDAEDR